MASLKRFRQSLVAIIAVAVGIMVQTPASAQDNGKREDGQGKYAELTADWWQWILEQLATNNPIFDETGEDAANRQPEKKVFFLAGVINVSGTAERTISVPAGKVLFTPILNVESDNASIPPTKFKVPELRALAANFIAGVTELHVTLDGVSLLDSISRIKSPVFSYTLPPMDNIYQHFGLDITGPSSPRCRMATGCFSDRCPAAPLTPSTLVGLPLASRWTSRITSLWNELTHGGDDRSSYLNLPPKELCQELRANSRVRAAALLG